MKPFTYNDYLEYKKINYKFTLSDQNEIYSYSKNIKQPHDKTYKTILQNKKEAAMFINEALKIEEKHKLKQDDLVYYNKSYITKNFENKEADIVYKLKNKNIFFLIEHQSSIDYSMPLRITNYALLIINNAVDRKKLKQKDYKYPSVYSIVLYTGKKKWNSNNFLEVCQERLLGCDISKFASYQLVDINNFTKEELLEKQGVLAKSLCLDKIEKQEELEKMLMKITNIKFNEEEIEILINIIYYSFSNKLGLDKVNKYIEKIKNIGGENAMFEAVIEDILKNQRENYQRGIKEGIKETKMAIIIELMKNKVGEDIIKKSTNISEEELKEIKKELYS